MFSNTPNKNDDALTKEFIDEIVENKNYYLALPLYADVYGLVGTSDDEMSHVLDEEENTDFRSQIVGGFVDFKAEINDKDEYWLYGTVRIPKKDKRISESIKNKFRNEDLFFSFEVVFDSYLFSNGITYLNRSDGNKLFAMAIVDNPAYDEAKALSLVASNNKADPGTEEKELDKTKKLVADENKEAQEVVEETAANVEEEQSTTEKVDNSDNQENIEADVEKASDDTAEAEVKVEAGVKHEQEDAAQDTVESSTENTDELESLQASEAEGEPIVASYEEKIQKLQNDLDNALQEIEGARAKLWEKERAVYEMQIASEKENIKEILEASKVEIDADIEALIQTLNYKDLFNVLAEKYQTLVNGFTVTPNTASASKNKKYDKNWVYSQSSDE